MADGTCRYCGTAIVVLDDLGRAVQQGDIGVCFECKAAAGRTTWAPVDPISAEEIYARYGEMDIILIPTMREWQGRQVMGDQGLHRAAPITRQDRR